MTCPKCNCSSSVCICTSQIGSSRRRSLGYRERDCLQFNYPIDLQRFNDFLWYPKTGTYGVALSDVNDYSLTGMSSPILAGIMNDTQIKSTLATALPKLFYMTGYKESSSTTASLTTQLSPNTQGFLREALPLSLKNEYSRTTSSAALTAISNFLDVY